MFGCLSPDCRLIPINRTKQWIPLVAEYVHHRKPRGHKPCSHRIVRHACDHAVKTMKRLGALQRIGVQEFKRPAVLAQRRVGNAATELAPIGAIPFHDHGDTPFSVMALVFHVKIIPNLPPNLHLHNPKIQLHGSGELWT